jgi:hypothetical protein
MMMILLLLLLFHYFCSKIMLISIKYTRNIDDCEELKRILVEIFIFRYHL